MKKIFVLFFISLISTSIFSQEDKSKILTSNKVDEICSANGMTRKTVTEFTIPAEYTVIDDYAFEECTFLEKVKLHSDITKIGDIAFGKTSITDLTIPSSIVSIGDHPFGKTNLKTLTILSKEPPKLANEYGDLFYNSNMSKELIIYVPDESVETYKNRWKNQRYIQIKSISSKANIDKPTMTSNNEDVSASETETVENNGDMDGFSVVVILISLALLVILIVYLIKKFIRVAKKVASQKIIPDERMDALNKGILPAVNSGSVILGKDEVCHFHGSVTYVKVKEKVIGYSGGGGGVSFRITKGIRLHTSSGNKKAIRGNVAQEDEGFLIITNKRIIGSAFNISFDKKLSSLSYLESSWKAILLQFGKEQYYCKSYESIYIDKIIRLAVKNNEN